MDRFAAAQQQQQQSAAPPPLPPELWNFVVIVLICGFVGWMMRLAQHFLTLVDVRFAVNSDAVRRSLAVVKTVPGFFLIPTHYLKHWRLLL